MIRALNSITLGDRATSDPIGTCGKETVRDELRDLARRTVKDTLNMFLEEKASNLVKAGRYERTTDCEVCRADFYERGLTTTFGQVALKMLKLQDMRFAATIIELHKRSETPSKRP